MKDQEQVVGNFQLLLQHKEDIWAKPEFYHVDAGLPLCLGSYLKAITERPDLFTVSQDNLNLHGASHARPSPKTLCGHSPYYILDFSGNFLTGTTSGDCFCPVCGTRYHYVTGGFGARWHYCKEIYAEDKKNNTISAKTISEIIQYINNNQK